MRGEFDRLGAMLGLRFISGSPRCVKIAPRVTRPSGRSALSRCTWVYSATACSMRRRSSGERRSSGSEARRVVASILTARIGSVRSAAASAQRCSGGTPPSPRKAPIRITGSVSASPRRRSAASAGARGEIRSHLGIRRRHRDPRRLRVSYRSVQQVRRRQRLAARRAQCIGEILKPLSNRSIPSLDSRRGPIGRFISMAIVAGVGCTHADSAIRSGDAKAMIMPGMDHHVGPRRHVT